MPHSRRSQPHVKRDTFSKFWECIRNPQIYLCTEFEVSCPLQSLGRGQLKISRFTTASEEGLDILFFRSCTCMLTTYQCCEGHKSMSKSRVVSLFNRIFKPHFYILTKLSITSKPHGRGA